MHNHIYKGIVIDSDDPLHMGRVKVFVPSVNMALVSDWNTNLEEDKFFVSVGDSCGQGMSEDIHKRLRIALPWAEVMLPVLGPSTPGRFDEGGFNTTSALIDQLPVTDVPNVPGTATMTQPQNQSINTSGSACRSEMGSGGDNINSDSETGYLSIDDLTSEQRQKGGDSNFRLTEADQFSPLNSWFHSNTSQKSISVPRINSMVYVMFDNGDAQYPIITGIVGRKEDFSGSNNRPTQ